ncbi:MAG: polysaccharide biosynthesis protein [Myxococcota bacterium]
MLRFLTRSTQTAIDLAILAMAFWLAFLLRFELDLSPGMLKRAMLLWPWVVLGQYAVMYVVGVPRFSWRYVGLREANRIFLALGISSLFLLAGRFGAPYLMELAHWLRHLSIPIGVVLIDFMLAFMGIAGVRILRRLAGERANTESRRRQANGDGCEPCRPVPTLLIGAGEAGVMVAKEIASWPGLGIAPVGFLDDDPMKLGSEIYGLRVLGTSAQCAEIAERTGAEQVLITISNVPGRVIRKLHAECREAGLDAKIIPGVYEIVGGKVNLERIRSVAIEDLLGREQVELETDVIAGAVQGRTVMVTGAGGSIGSELCRQIIGFDPALVLLVEQAENALFEIHRELLGLDHALPVVPVIADVTDRSRMKAIFQRYRPEVVLHAAAHKHVPMMEWNPGEAVKNNVFGTRTVADLADAHGVKRFVLISTDKAVNPTSVMGATKRVAEIYIQAISARSKTKFLAVRFGNVLGSSGSVIPIFRRQIAAGGPVTVTHPEMKRYFMTIPEACQLVLQAGAMGEGGEVFILDMGEPVKISDLARDMIRLSGMEPGEDIDIEYTGMRPGEKLFEELSVQDEAADKTRHPKIFVGKIAPRPWDEVVQGIEGLWELRDEAEIEAVLGGISGVVPEFVGGEKTPDTTLPLTA